MDVDELWPMPRDDAADVAVRRLTPDRSLPKRQFRKRVHLIVVNRIPDDLMTSSFQKSGLVGYDQVFAADLLIKIVDNQDLHSRVFT